MKANYYFEHLILTGLFGTLILPSIAIGIEIRVITLVSFILIMLLPYMIYKEKIKINRFVVCYGLIVMAIFFSINHSYIFLGVQSTYRDYMELFLYLQVMPYLLFASAINYETFERKFLIYLNISVLYVIFIATIQITNIANLGRYVGLMYAPSDHVEHMISSSSNRILLTGSDPNIGAMIVLFFLILTFFSKEIKVYKILSLFYILLMTQSRTVFLGFVVSLFIYTLIFSKINILTKVFSIAIVTYLLYEVLYFLNLEYIIIGFQMAAEGVNNSLNVRIENIFLAYDRFLESMLLGWGPAKSIHATIIDSEYALIMQRYGLIGIAMFAGYLGLMINFSYNLYKKQIVSKINFSLVGFMVPITGIVIMATNNFFAGYQSIAISTLTVVSLISYKRSIY